MFIRVIWHKLDHTLYMTIVRQMKTRVRKYINSSIHEYKSKYFASRYLGCFQFEK